MFFAALADSGVAASTRGGASRGKGASSQVKTMQRPSAIGTSLDEVVLSVQVADQHERKEAKLQPHRIVRHAFALRLLPVLIARQLDR